MSEADEDGIETDRTTVIDREEIVLQLNHLNTNAKTVYLSIYRTAQHLRRRYDVIAHAGAKAVPSDEAAAA